MLLSVQSINPPRGRALNNHQSNLGKKITTSSVKHIASFPSVSGILSSGFPALAQVSQRFPKVWQLREQFCFVVLFILLSPNESGVCHADPWLQELVIKGRRGRVAGREDPLVMEGAKGRAWRKTGHLGLAGGGGHRILCAPLLQRDLGQQRRVQPVRGRPGTTRCPNAVGAGVRAGFQSLMLELQPGARARERVSIATAATHSPSWM